MSQDEKDTKTDETTGWGWGDYSGVADPEEKPAEATAEEVETERHESHEEIKAVHDRLDSLEALFRDSISTLTNAISELRGHPSNAEAVETEKDPAPPPSGPAETEGHQADGRLSAATQLVARLGGRAPMPTKEEVEQGAPGYAKFVNDELKPYDITEEEWLTTLLPWMMEDNPDARNWKEMEEWAKAHASAT